jgi:hypothetical protein
MPEPIYMKLGMYIMTSEPISTAYFINPSHQSVCLYVYLPIVARQRLGGNVTTATNTHAKIEELLDASFSMRSGLYQRKVGDYFFRELLVLLTELSSFSADRSAFKYPKNHTILYIVIYSVLIEGC